MDLDDGQALLADDARDHGLAALEGALRDRERVAFAVRDADRDDAVLRARGFLEPGALVCAHGEELLELHEQAGELRDGAEACGDGRGVGRDDDDVAREQALFDVDPLAFELEAVDERRGEALLDEGLGVVRRGARRGRGGERVRVVYALAGDHHAVEDVVDHAADEALSAGLDLDYVPAWARHGGVLSAGVRAKRLTFRARRCGAAWHGVPSLGTASPPERLARGFFYSPLS